MPDKFEEMTAKLERLAEAERKDAMNSLRKKCICPDCPTYTECARANSELVFCLEGKSPTCITKAVKCICADCPVEEEYGMKDLFYCIEGAEAEKRKRRADRQKARMQK